MDSQRKDIATQAAALRRLQAPVFLLAMTVGFFWRLTLSRGFTWLDNPDLVNQVLPWLSFQTREWRRGLVPLWDPHHWGGQSLIGQGQPGVVSPMNWILFLAPLENGHVPEWALNSYFVLIHYLAVLSCYWLCRDLGVSRLAAIMAGCAFGLGGFVGSTDWPQMLNGLVYAPVVLLFSLRLLKGRDPFLSASAAGMVLGLSFLSGHHQTPIFLALLLSAVLTVYGVHRTAQDGLRGLTAAAGIAAGAISFAGMFGAPQILPAFEYFSRSLRWVGSLNPVTLGEKVPYSVHELYAYNPVAILGLVIPGIVTNVSPFVGPTCLSLAMFGVATAWSSRVVRVLTFLAVGSLLISLGGASLPHGILYCLFPAFDKARTPAAVLFLFDLCVFILAACGLDVLRMQRPAEPVAAALAKILGAAGAAIFLCLLAVALFMRERVFELGDVGFVSLTILLTGCVFWGRARQAVRPGTACVMLLTIVLLEHGAAMAKKFSHRESGWRFYTQLSAHDDIADYLKRNVQSARVSVERKDIPYNFGDWYGIDELTGYAGVSANVHRVHAERGAQTLLRVAYHVGRREWYSDQKPVFQGRSGVRVFKNPDLLPEAWTPRNIRTAKGFEDIEEFLRSGVDHLLTAAVVAGPVPQSECPATRDNIATIAASSSREISLKVRMECSGLVVLSHTFDPTWRVSIDGDQATPIEVNGFLLGVWVPEGDHDVQLRYLPTVVLAGTALFLAGVALLIAVVVYRKPIDRLFAERGTSWVQTSFDQRGIVDFRTLH